MMKKKMADELEATSGPSASQAFQLHLICGLGLTSSLYLIHNFYLINLVSHPSQSLRMIWVVETPIVVLLYSLFRRNPKQCSFLKAVGRSTLGIPAGALANALGAIALGAPVGLQDFPKTIYWSLLMSLFTFVPAASVFGSSWTDWQRIFAHTKPVETIDYMICLPAHGAVIGAWFGAWPMPLDWERPWQVCRTLYFSPLSHNVPRSCCGQLMRLEYEKTGVACVRKLRSHGRVLAWNGCIFWLCAFTWQTTTCQGGLNGWVFLQNIILTEGSLILGCAKY